MKATLRIYSDILQLRRETITALFETHAGIAFAFKMFFIVMLIAGLGRWFGIPVLIRQPVLSEEIHSAAQTVDRISSRTIEVADASLETVSQENISRLINQAINDMIARGIDITAEALSDALAQAGVTPASLQAVLDSVEAAPEQFGLLAEEVAAAQTQLETEAADALVSSETIDQLLADLDLTPAQLMLLLDRAPDLAEMTRAAEAESLAEITPASEELVATLAQIPVTPGQIRQYLTDMFVTPERIVNISVRLGLTEDQQAAIHAQLTDGATRIDSALAQAEEKATQLEPPLGTRTSRLIRLFGQWLATPFEVMAQWLFFALVALLMARLFGGRGTVSQHLAAVALAAAPAVLLFMTYVPEMQRVLFFSYSIAFDYFGRVLALIAIVWMALILLKALAISHHFSLWRSAATLVVTWLIIWVVIPAASMAALFYVLRG